MDPNQFGSESALLSLWDATGLRPEGHPDLDADLHGLPLRPLDPFQADAGPSHPTHA